jgi:dihydrofolate synthase/folylpolyglutamate synthase
VKAGRPVIVGRLTPTARAVIDEVAAERGAAVVGAFDDVEIDTRQRGFDTEVAIATPRARYGPLRLGLAGRHQADNAVVAVRVLETLAGAGDRVSASDVESGLRDVQWPARLERLERPGGPTWLLDAAHNPAGAVTLASYLRTVAPGGVPILFAAMRDKDADSMLAALAPAATRFVMTRPAVPRARAPEELASIASRLGVPVEVVPEVADALARAATLAPLVVACGSIFLLGEVRAALAPGGNDGHVS